MRCAGEQRAAGDLVHLELHTSNSRAALDFLSPLLDWRGERIVSAGQSYLAMGMGEWIGGGVVECGTTDAQWLPYVRVACVDEATELAKRLGACVVLDPRQGPHGRRSVVSTASTGDIALWAPSTGRTR